MKKAIIGLALLVFGSAQAYEVPSYQMLYWQVTADSQQLYGASLVNVYAQLDDAGTIRLGEDTSFLDAGKDTSSYSDVQSWWSNGDLSKATFYAELLNENFGTLATSEAVSYGVIKANMATSWSSPTPPTYTPPPYTFTFAIPEPTGAALVLLGLAGLALRRKRLA